MSLRHALLGLLHGAPASGYDLTKQFGERLERFAWHARHSQIYPELGKMLADDLIEVVEEGPRGRRTYAITDAGRAELREWMMRPPANPQVRRESLLRMFLLSTLDSEDARQLLARHAEAVRAESERLREVIATRFDGADDPDDPRWADRLIVEAGLRHAEASYAWTKWAMRLLETCGTR
ncbi:PadR family transcriptional regulator [Fodinicola acaciae]|uniref:PadR family transcriptional regulator n=1 Tax=Fodinicola acaciae TaxID=2681555 RepID=UPI0013D610F1|nr:PadR family transcriptional regulator [Fodinicola acaciae]